MKHLLIFLVSIFSLLKLNAQNEIVQPVKWTYSFTENEHNEIELTFQAKIEDGWSLYSQYITGDGPIPTSINYESDIVLIDEQAKETGTHRTEKHDEMFDMVLIKYKDDLTLTQTIKTENNIKTISGYIEYMCCTNEQCIFPEPYKFTFNLKK